MPFDLHHILASAAYTPHKQVVGEEASFKVVSDPKPFDLVHPGRLARSAFLSFTQRVVDTLPGDPSEPGGHPHHPGSDTQKGTAHLQHLIVPLKLTVFDPTGAEFSGDVVTLAELRRHSDRRGTPVPWSYEVSGESALFPVGEGFDITGPSASALLSLIEPIASQSAPPLVADRTVAAAGETFGFDLFREGRFTAEVRSDGAWQGSMTLRNPDGTAAASTASRMLEYDVGLETIAKSRDHGGHPRFWTLEVRPHGGVVTGAPRVTAEVVGASRIHPATINDRITRMIGPNGAFIHLFGENRGSKATCRLVITDDLAAETLDMYGFLDGPLGKVPQDPGVDPYDLRANTTYTLFQADADLGYTAILDVSTLKVIGIGAEVGHGVRLGPEIPAARLRLNVAGEVRLSLLGNEFATASVEGGQLEFEVGVAVSDDGTPRLVTWVPTDAIDVDLSWEAILEIAGTAGSIAGPQVAALAALGAEGAAAYFEGVLNDRLASGLGALLDPNLAPRLLMVLHGAHLTHLAPRFEGEDILFEYVAPVEPEPKPRPDYAGVIGRQYVDLGIGGVRFTPQSLGDTWTAGNLAKIEHIVVVMMENRSYDHVLGYRWAPPALNPGTGKSTPHAKLPAGAGVGSPEAVDLDALSPDLIAAIEAAAGDGHKVRNLRDAGFPANAFGHKTRIPQGVGHSYSDVREQLGGRAPGPGGVEINDPKGFLDNFAKQLGSDAQGVVVDDVLGYYDANDLPFSAYLAQNYTYCPDYYSSHPGPTLPNRMYSLTGDVQYDRSGIPIVNNNHGDNFQLSRAPTIYDVLTKLGVTWRVYESEPSITMLRFFARYAGNGTDIVSLDELEFDVQHDDPFPSFVAIEPALHHQPENDDHPPADMWRGQVFLQRVYTALRSKPSLWEKTLLIITYDEHGGLYDHRVPPVADLLRAPAGGPGPGAGSVLGEPPAAGPGHGSGPHFVPGPGGLTNAPEDEPAPPEDDRPTLPIQYGVRVPTFLVSPWVPAAKGPAVLLDHCSILKTVLARFAGAERPFLSDRVAASHSFDAFLTESQPRPVPPLTQVLQDLPISEPPPPPPVDLTGITTPALSRHAMREGPVEFHELSGRLARMLGR